jgi:hypothetical protein
LVESSKSKSNWDQHWTSLLETHLVFVLLLDELNAEVPLGIGLCLNGVPKVSPMEIRVLPVELESQRLPP